MTDLSNLIARVRSATGSDWRLSDDIHWALVNLPSGTAREHDGRRETNVAALWGGEDWRGIGPYFFGSADCTASLDAAIELCERVLPNARIKFDFDDSYARAEIWQGRGYAREKLLALHEDPNGEAALALTLAVLLAKQEIEQ